MFPLSGVTFSQADSHASRSRWLDSKTAWTMLGSSGRQCSTLSSHQGPLGSFVRMFLASSDWNSTVCLMTWKSSAMRRNRLLFQLAVLEQDISETGFGLLPTTRASISKKSQVVSQARTISESGNAWQRLSGYLWKPDRETYLAEMAGDVYGVSEWVDRSRALGNAILPQIAFQIARAIKACY